MSAVCDFCSDPDPAWFYSASDFAAREAGWGSTGGWAACERCSQLIEEKEDQKVVHERMLGSPLARALSAMVGLQLTKREKRELEDRTWTLYRRFKAQRRGERRAFG